MTNTFGPIVPDFNDPEEFIRYLEGPESNILIEPYGFLKSDKLNTVGLVDDIRNAISEIVTYRHISNPQVLKLTDYHSKARFQAFGVDSFFNPPPRESCDYGRSGPVCVICDDDHAILYANRAYVDATGLDGRYNRDEWVELVGEEMADKPIIDKIKYLSGVKIIHPDPEIGEISKLYDLIYDESNLKRIKANLDGLENTQGYSDIFMMKHTRRMFLWKTLQNKRFKGNIRSAIEIDDASHPLVTRFLQEKRQIAAGDYEEPKYFPFGFYATVLAYKGIVNQVLEGSEDIHLKGLFDCLLENATVGDTFFDHSYFLIRGHDGRYNYFNNEFARNTDLKPEEIKDLLDSGDMSTFVKRVYGTGADNLWVKKHLESLRSQKHYFSDFFPIRGGRKLSVSYDTFRYDYPPVPEDHVHDARDTSAFKTFGIGALENY